MKVIVRGVKVENFNKGQNGMACPTHHKTRQIAVAKFYLMVNAPLSGQKNCPVKKIIRTKKLSGQKNCPDKKLSGQKTVWTKKYPDKEIVRTKQIVQTKNCPDKINCPDKKKLSGQKKYSGQQKNCQNKQKKDKVGLSIGKPYTIENVKYLTSSINQSIFFRINFVNYQTSAI